MTNLKRFTLLCLPAVVAAIGLHTLGCASTASTPGYQLAAKTATSMESTRTEVLLVRQQVAATVGMLNKLVKSADTDLVPQYKQFVKDLKGIESLARQVGRRADEMHRRGASYFAGWAAEVATINNPDIRHATVQRRAESLASYTEVDNAMQEAKAAFDPFLSDLKDIQKYLKEDLNATGLQSISGTVGEANLEARNLQAKINAVLAQLERVAKDLSSQPMQSP